MRKQKLHVLTMIIGLLLAGAIVCTHVFQVETLDSKKLVKSEQNADSSHHDQTFLASAPTIIPSASINLHTDLIAYCLFEIPQPEADSDNESAEAGFKPQKFLLTLFRVIISPNAP
jgi:hypothetical protein